MSAPVRVARKRLDVTAADLVRGLRFCVAAPSRPVAERRVAAAWTPPEAVISCLAARSGLDLLLACVGWPPGSEVLLSAVTIPHLPVLIRAHGYVPVPVDVDPATLRLEPAVRAACTPRTRALVHAQLLAAQDDVAALAALAGDAGRRPPPCLLPLRPAGPGSPTGCSTTSPTGCSGGPGPVSCWPACSNRTCATWGARRRGGHTGCSPWSPAIPTLWWLRAGRPAST